MKIFFNLFFDNNSSSQAIETQINFDLIISFQSQLLYNVFESVPTEESHSFQNLSNLGPGEIIERKEKHLVLGFL